MNAVTPIRKDKPKLDIDAMTQLWRIAKQAEVEAHDRRIEIENAILAEIETKPEGTTKVGAMTISTGFSRSWDQDKLDDLRASVRGEYWPFAREWKEDRKAARVIEERFPDLWKRINEALTLKPKKPTFSVKEG